MLGVFFKGGVNLPHNKNTKNLKTMQMDIPKKIIIPMLQHIGAVCNPIVKKGDNVNVGQCIGESEAFISSPIHSSVSGKILDIKQLLYPGGFDVTTVEIEPDKKQTLDSTIKSPGNLSDKDLISAIKKSGLVGLGGAGFPSFVKLSPPPDKKVDTLVVNGAECEPYITSDYREMIENTDSIIDGIKIIMDLTKVKKTIIGIESNKPEAIQLLKSKLNNNSGIEVVSLKTIYPQGAEKQLIYMLTGKKVPSGGLPSDVGIIVHNINSVSFISTFLKTGIPLIKKKVTVDGEAVNNPKNVEVLIGTRLEDVFNFCGGFKEDPYKVIMGGPMMGVSQFSLETSVIKQTNALLAFTKSKSISPKEETCIRCGKCVEACPMDLLPLNLNLNVANNNIEETTKYNLYDCIECGCCSFICPSRRNLVQSIRYAKAYLKKNKK